MAITSSYDIVDGNRVDNPTDDTTYVFNPSATLKTFSLAGGTDGDTVAINALSSDFKVKFKKNEMTLIGLKNTPSFGTMVKVQFDTSNGGADHITFLDGTIDVQFTPNTPGALKGTWNFGGHNGIKKLNLGAEGATYTIDSTKTFADAAYEASGELESQRYVLTTEMDDIEIETDNTYDTVRGIIDYAGEDSDSSTVTPLDTIIGNGHTQLEIGVHDVNGGAYEADYIRLSGVDKINVIDAAGSGELTLDASSYGSDVSYIGFEGKGGLDLNVSNLEVNGSLNVASVNEDSCISVCGTVDDLNFMLCMTNCTSSSEITFGVAGISMQSGGDGSSLELCITQTDSACCTDVSVGDISIGNVDVQVGVSADDTISISNYACAGTSGNATAGDLTLGAVNIDIGQSGDFSMFLTNCADADEGDAIVGNVTVGAMNVDLDVCGDFTEYYVYNSAGASTGSATVGNMTFGDIDISMDDCATGLYLYAYNCACGGDGTATAGDLTFGDFNISGGEGNYITMGAYNEAWAYGTDNGATQGNVTIGDMNINLGIDGYVCVDVSNYGSASCGDIISGDLSVGDLNLVMGSSSTACFNYSNDIEAGKSATGGKMVIGDINVDINGIYGCFYYSATNNVCGGTASAIGDMVVGNIDVYAGADAYISMTFDQCADGGYAGNVTFGDVNMEIENAGSNSCATAYFCLTVSGESVGNVAIGDVTFTGGSNSYYDACICVTATDESAGNISIGDVTLTPGVSGTAYFTNYVCADNNLGNVSYGNIVADASAKDAYVYAYMWHSADYGSMGNISTGNITVNAGEDACAYVCASWSASDEIGTATFGDIALNAVGDNATAEVLLEVYGCDDIGNITYGDISMVADGVSAYACAYISADNDANHAIGTVTVGNIDMNVTGEDACGYLSMSYSSAETIGQVTVGSINIALDIDVAATASFSNQTADAYVYICSDAGDVAVGNIDLSAASVTASYDGDADVYAYVNLCASDELTVGNITVAGGYENASGVADNFATLTSWLSLNGTTITIGNVDYSNYLSTATIDVSSFDGAAIITAAQDDSTITVNDGKNTVHLGDGSDTVNVTKNDVADATAQADIDVIYNFTQGDDVVDGGVSGDFAWGGTATNYTTFLAAATNGMSTLSYEVYAARVGADTYVAFNTDGDTDLDFVVRLVGNTTALTASDVGV